MKESANIGIIVSILLLCAVMEIYTMAESRVIKDGKKIPKVFKFIFCCFVVLLGIFLAICMASRLPEAFVEPGSGPQTIIVMDHSGGIIVKYENVGGDSYTYRNGNLIVTVDGVKYTYINATVEIIEDSAED